MLLALKLTIRIIARGDMVGINSGSELEKFCKINNVVTMLNDMKDFSCIDLKCSVMFFFKSCC